MIATKLGFESTPWKTFHSDGDDRSFSGVGRRLALNSLKSCNMTKTLKKTDQFKDPFVGSNSMGGSIGNVDGMNKTQNKIKIWYIEWPMMFAVITGL